MVTLGVALIFLRIGVERDLAEGVAAAGDHNQFLVAGDAIQPVQRVIHGVEDIGLAETGNAQRVERAEDRLLVLGEVHQDVRLHVEFFDGDPVLRLQVGGERVRGIQRVIHEVVIGGCELHQQHCGDGRLAHGDALDLLRHAIFANLEVFLGCLLRQCQGASVLLQHARIHAHHGNIDVQRILRIVGGLLSAWAAAAPLPCPSS